MTNSIKLRIALALLLLAAGVGAWQHPEWTPQAVDSVASWFGLSSKLDTVVIVYESADVPKYGKGNHAGWSQIIVSSTLKDSLSAKGIKLIGPLDRDTTGKFPPGVKEAIDANHDQPMARMFGFAGSKLKVNVVLPDTEAAVLKKAGI